MKYMLTFIQNGEYFSTFITPADDKTVLAQVRDLLEADVGDPDVVFGLYDPEGNLIFSDEDIVEWAD